jgi:hypothetical protein
MQFILRLACQLLSDQKTEDEPSKLIMNPKVRMNPMFLLLQEICMKTVRPFLLKEEEIYPFICDIKLKVKTLMSSDCSTLIKQL